MAGFAQIIREEQNNQTRNHMLEYLSNIMEDSHDFGWQAAMASHAVLLCKMEESKIDWHETNKIDHVRRVHAQTASSNHSQSLANKRTSSRSPTPCRYFQKGTCSKKMDHEANGITYLHVCQTCFSQGKSHKHSANDCKSHSKNK